MSTQPLNLNLATPAAEAGHVNVKWQADPPNADLAVVRNVSAEIAIMTNTLAGLAPTPPNDATKFLDGTGAFSTPGSGGGGGGGIYPSMTAPLASRFTWKNQGTATVADKTGRLVVSIPDYNTTVTPLIALFENIPAAPYTLDVAFSLIGISQNTYGDFGYIALRESSSGTWVTLGIACQANTAQSSYCLLRTDWRTEGTSYVTSALTGEQVFVNPSLIWLRLTDDGTNRNFYLSNNGRDWTLVFFEGNTVEITPDQIGLAFLNRSGGISGAPVMVASVYHYLITNSLLPAIGS